MLETSVVHFLSTKIKTALKLTVIIFFFFSEFDSSKRQQEIDKKAIDDLVRERDILNKNLLKAAGATQKQLNLVRLHEQAKKNLEQEIQVCLWFYLFVLFILPDKNFCSFIKKYNNITIFFFKRITCYPLKMF